MKLPSIGRFGIAKKIAVSNVLVILLATISGVYGLIILRNSRDIDNVVVQGYYPMIDLLEEFDKLTVLTNSLSTNWIYLPNDQDKADLVAIKDMTFPEMEKALQERISVWPDNSLDTLNALLELYKETVPFQERLMSELGSNEDYANSHIIYDAIATLDNDIAMPLDELHDGIQFEIERLKSEAEGMIATKYASFDRVEWMIIMFTLLAILLGSTASVLSIKMIVNPIAKLNQVIARLSTGELPDISIRTSNDEVGDMTNSIKDLRSALTNKSVFATEIGKGNLEAEYEALSQDDVLGLELLAMRDKLKRVIGETREVVVEAGANGKLNTRMETEGKEGAWKDLSNVINDLLFSIATPVVTVNRIVNAMSEGDLTMRYTESSQGEVSVLARNLNKALDNLNHLLLQISESANTIDSSSSEMLFSGEEMRTNTGEIASAIAQMSTGAQSQVTKVDESSNLAESVLNSSNEMGEKSENINLAAQAGVRSSQKGAEMVHNVVDRMGEISNYSLKTNDSIKVLTERSKEINRVLGVITEIAAQTNLLALNAAIEAAQAGEAGRGFAVVAEEIRKLAEDSRNSAQEIEALIGDVQKDTEGAAYAIDEMAKSVKSGEEASQMVSEVFKEIADSSGKTLSSSEEILTAAKAQVQDINSIVTITEGIVVIAEQTAAGTEEAASSASELSSGMENYALKAQRLTEIAQNLKEGVNKFKLSDQELKDTLEQNGISLTANGVNGNGMNGNGHHYN